MNDAHIARAGEAAYDVFGVPGDPEANERLRADLAAVTEAERRALRSASVGHRDIRQITVGNIHAQPGDPRKVTRYYEWLMQNPTLDLPPIDVRHKPNGTYRIHDGRHRFLAYVLAERASIPVEVGGPDD